jgi:hypothetical protein
VIDFLAEAELKAAEQAVAEIFEVKQVRQCRSVMDHKELGKHARPESISVLQSW